MSIVIQIYKVIDNVKFIKALKFGQQPKYDDFLLDDATFDAMYFGRWSDGEKHDSLELLPRRTARRFFNKRYAQDEDKLRMAFGNDVIPVQTVLYLEAKCFKKIWRRNNTVYMATTKKHVDRLLRELLNGKQTGATEIYHQCLDIFEDGMIFMLRW